MSKRIEKSGLSNLMTEFGTKAKMIEKSRETGLTWVSDCDKGGAVRLGQCVRWEGRRESEPKLLPLEFGLDPEKDFPVSIECDSEETAQEVAEVICASLSGRETGKRTIVVTGDRRFRRLFRTGETEAGSSGDGRFVPFGDASTGGLTLNPLRIPKGVEPEKWMKTIVEAICETLETGAEMKLGIESVLREEYEKAGCLGKRESGVDANERSKAVTLKRLWRKMSEIRDAWLMTHTKASDRWRFDEFLEAFEKFAEPDSKPAATLSAEDEDGNGTGLDLRELVEGGFPGERLGKNRPRTVVLETFGLDETTRKFAEKFCAEGLGILFGNDEDVYVVADDVAFAPDASRRRRRIVSLTTPKGNLMPRGCFMTAFRTTITDKPRLEGKIEKTLLPERILWANRSVGREGAFLFERPKTDVDVSDATMRERSIRGEAEIELAAFDSETGNESSFVSAVSSAFESTVPTASADRNDEFEREVERKKIRDLCEKIRARARKEFSGRRPADDVDELDEATRAFDEYCDENVETLEKLLVVVRTRGEEIRKLKAEIAELRKEAEESPEADGFVPVRVADGENEV